jgi:hypothetical protein
MTTFRIELDESADYFVTVEFPMDCTFNATFNTITFIPDREDVTDNSEIMEFHAKHSSLRGFMGDAKHTTKMEVFLENDIVVKLGWSDFAPEPTASPSIALFALKELSAMDPANAEVYANKIKEQEDKDKDRPPPMQIIIDDDLNKGLTEKDETGRPAVRCIYNNLCNLYFRTFRVVGIKYDGKNYPRRKDIDILKERKLDI